MIRALSVLLLGAIVLGLIPMGGKTFQVFIRKSSSISTQVGQQNDWIDVN